jgi:hypothetical protein
MREDMAKVIVERPRCGSWMRARHRKGYHRRQQQIASGNEPKRERIKEAYGGSTKYLNEHLAPAAPFLAIERWTTLGQGLLGDLCSY